MQRHEHVGVHGGGRAQVDHPAAQGQLVLEHLEVGAAQKVGGPAGLDERMGQPWVGLADHHRAARLDDAGLLGGDVQRGGPGVLGVVDPDVGDHGNLRLADVGGVPPAEQAHLDDGDVDRDVGEPAERGGGDGFEVAGVHPRDGLEVCHRGHLLGELVVADRLAVAADALVEAFEVGLVYVPTDSPCAISRRVIICVVEPLPLVPVTWMTG